MSGSGWLRVKRTIVAMIAAAGLCLIAAPLALSSSTGGTYAEARYDPGQLRVPSASASAEELVWAEDRVPAEGASVGGLAISLLAALSVLFVTAAIIMRNAQSPRRREGPGADVKRALSLIASHWPEQIDASHLAMLRG